jgi:hypothetical protein
MAVAEVTAMNASAFWIRFVLAVLATWRITHLLAREDGPADLIARLRRRLGDSFAGKMMDCFGCLSLWVAIPFAFFVGEGLLELTLSWLALSGAAFLLERASPEPLVIQQLPATTKEGANDGVLRSDANSQRPRDDADRSPRG